MNNDKSAKQFTRGGQIAFHDVRMFFQINKTLIRIHLIVLFLLAGGLMWTFTSAELFKVTAAYHYSKLVSDFGVTNTINVPVQGRSYALPVNVIAKHPYFQNSAHTFKKNLLDSFLKSMVLSLLMSIGLGFYFVRKGRKKANDVFIRGGSLADVKTVKKLIIQNNEASPLTLDGLPLIKNAEVQHFLVHGTIGMGKSQLIMKLLDQLRARGDRVIIYDKGCSYTSIYFDETKDVLLNPYDDRCANWSLWLEAQKDADLENLAESLIPIEGESQPFFIHAARAVFSATASKMRQDSDCSLKKLLQFLLTGEFSQMEPYLAGTPAATLMSDKVEKMAISVRSMITTYVRSLQSLRGLEESDKQPFCIRDYILNEETDGWLFISSNGEKHNSLKPLMSMWLSIASLSLLSLPESLNRRVWFICDELPSLHQLPFLSSTLAEVRKFGGCFILGMQNFFQLSQVYGNRGAGAIFDLLNTRFFFRSPSAEMAKRVSIELCNEELEEVKESTSYGANSIRDGVSLSSNRTSRPLVDYSEIMKLKILSCFARMPGDYPITKIDLKLNKRSEKAQGFIERELPVDPQNNESFCLTNPMTQSLMQSTTETSSDILKKNLLVEFDV
jgi:type IV conjugative transfer system coupling protein TraD